MPYKINTDVPELLQGSRISTFRHFFLFEILEACAASKRTSLHGLDNIAAEGSEGYDNLINLVEDLHSMNVINSEESKELTNSIISSKLYMKTDYKLHVQEEN